MVLKIHGSPQSTCTRRVVTVLIEKQVPYELIPINFAVNEHKSPAHLEKQPFGKIPVLEEEDGTFLYESRAIAQYIALKYRNQGTKLFPDEDDVKGFGKLQQAISVELCNFDAYASGYAYEKLFKSFHGLGGPDEAKVAEYTQKLESTLAIYDNILAKQKYFTGEEVSLADLFHLPYASLTETLGLADLYAKYPNFHRWLKDLQSRESWKASGQ